MHPSPLHRTGRPKLSGDEHVRRAQIIRAELLSPNPNPKAAAWSIGRGVALVHKIATALGIQTMWVTRAEREALLERRRTSGPLVP
jgi:hypothetical protein